MTHTPIIRRTHTAVALTAGLLLHTTFTLAEHHQDDTDLLALLDQQTRIATQTRLNVKHVPGIVDVLYGKQLRERGYQTVLDALSRLPGIQTLTNGYRTNPNVRGNISDALQGDLQILINGVAQVSGNDLQPFVTLDLPLAVVERIEIIKGPGSAVYGEFALNGVINIITLPDTEGGRAFLGGGDFDTQSAAVNQRWDGEHGYLALSAQHYQTDGQESLVQSDFFSNVVEPVFAAFGGTAASNAPGQADTRVEFDSFILQGRYRNTQVDASVFSTLHGDQLGAAEGLTDGDEYNDQFDSIAVQLAHTFESIGSGDLTVFLGHQRHEFDRRILILPEGAVDFQSPIFPLANPEDAFLNIEGQVDRNYVRVKWVGEPGEHHRVLVEAGYQDLDVPETRDTTNFNFTTNAILPVPVSSNRVLSNPTSLAGAERQISSFVFQDEIRLSPATRLTLGLRLDDDQERSSEVSPRMALLHELTERNILKFQLARAFRPPTLSQDVNAVRRLRNERIDTLEFQYLYHGDRFTTNHAAYVSWLEDKLVPDIFFTGNINDITSRNFEERLRFYGLESSFRYKVNDPLQLEANLAYQQAGGIPLQQSSVFISPFTLDVNATWNMNPFITLFVEQRYFSARDRRPDDARGEFPHQTFTNFSMAFTPPASDKLSLTVSVENLFDRNIRLPSGWFAVGSFPDDLPGPDRRFLAALEYRW